jgi:peptidoglycan/xylan/chitin deacetylase (PgdA/CDA1 family)
MRTVIALAILVMASLGAVALVKMQKPETPTEIPAIAAVASPPQAEPPAAAPRQVVRTQTDAPEITSSPGTQIAQAVIRPATPAPTATPAVSPAPSAAPAPAATPVAAPPPPPAAPAPTCANPDALGVARVVEIDTTGGPGFGFEHFKMYDFLKDKEVVLTFDDGPWLTTTPHVLKALADQCVKATFFPIGKHATYYPEVLKQVAAAGHTIGSHTWSHADLSKKTAEEAKEEIEHGLSAVKWAVGGPTAPFFRFPALRHPPEALAYLAERNIGVFSTDMDSFDFKVHKPEKIVSGLMAKLQKRGKGIILMHDFQAGTAHALPQLLAELKAGGYKIVHLKPRASVTTIAQYDDLMLKDPKLNPAVGASRPLGNVVRTISGE